MIWNLQKLFYTTNDFGEINDLYGFDIGDRILIEVGTIIAKSLQDENCTLYKLPSDEYAVLIDTAYDIYSFQELIAQLIYNIANHEFKADDFFIHLGVTIGIAHAKNNILSNADIALKDARKLKKAYLVYNEDSKSKERSRENMYWSKTIKAAIKDHRVIPYYQPIFNNQTHQIEKFEALVRLIDDEGRIISPYFFLKIAKKYRLYDQITKLMIDKSFEHFEHSIYSFSVNLSIEDILDESTVDYIIEKVSTFNEPQRIIFEITESEGIENYSDVQHFLQTIKKYGCKIAIDDFGTGYSNFEYILKLDVDFLKIDGSLIKDIANNKENRIVVKTILQFANKLGIQTITEFVSSQQSFELVQTLGANFSQGYFIGEPKETITPVTHLFQSK